MKKYTWEDWFYGVALPPFTILMACFLLNDIGINMSHQWAYWVSWGISLLCLVFAVLTLQTAIKGK